MPYNDTYANNFLDVTFAKTGSSVTPPSSVYIGLCTNDPESSGGTVRELSGGGYSRVLISQKGQSYPSIISAASARSSRNHAQINWTKATAAWQRVNGFFLSSSNQVGETGQIFFYGKLDLTPEDEAAGGLLVEEGMVALFDPQSFGISFPFFDSE